MPVVNLPDYAGGSLVNLIAEIEHRLTGSSASPPLHPHLAAELPDAATYVVVLFDGLGAAQLDHPSAATLADHQRATLDAPFPSTTTVSLASVATGLAPSQHGLLGYQLYLPEIDGVVNSIKWTTLWGSPVDVDTDGFLPEPNLWERLIGAGVEAITVQPAGFEGSGLTKALYRGARFEGVATYAEQVDATRSLAKVPGRLIYTYVAAIDYAAHVHGQDSDAYADAVALSDWVWSSLATRLPEGAVLVGTADHGHVDFPADRQIKIAKDDHEGRTFFGDGRAMFVRGEGATLANDLPATWVPIEEAIEWWGPGPRHPEFDARKPDGVLLADDNTLLLHRFSDDRMIGNHGAMTAAEQRIPLLVVAD